MKPPTKNGGTASLIIEKTAAGFELERAGSPLRSLRAGVDLYWVAFPNFESSSEAQQFGGEVNAVNPRPRLPKFGRFHLGGRPIVAPRALSATASASDRRFGDQIWSKWTAPTPERFGTISSFFRLRRPATTRRGARVPMGLGGQRDGVGRFGGVAELQPK